MTEEQRIAFATACGALRCALAAADSCGVNYCQPGSIVPPEDVETFLWHVAVAKKMLDEAFEDPSDDFDDEA